MRIRKQQTAALASTDFQDNDVQIFDNVFSSEVCEELHCLALDHSDRCGVRSSVFYWSSDDDDDNMLTPLERALSSFLQKMPMPKQANPVVVEYWSREEYINMDTHSDIDEQELLNEGTVRCPDFGHVLYLQVDPSFRGPTCVFSQHGGWPASDGSTSSLVTIPAVPGRVLRFPGSAMHAVPKPPTLWFLNKETQRKALEEEEDWGDGEERSVILFNVWVNGGPLGVTEDFDSKGMLPAGIQLLVENVIGEEQRVAAWDQEYGPDCSDLWCEPREEWHEQAIVHNNIKQGDTAQIRVPLMGNKARRLYPKSHVCLSTPSTLAAALQDESSPQHFVLREEENHGDNV